MEKTKEEYKKEKGERIVIMIEHCIEMLSDLQQDVGQWSSRECSTEELTNQSIHQNETCAALKQLVEFLEYREKKNERSRVHNVESH